MRVPSAKRWASTLNGLHSWFPYYAGFSPDFVKQALSELDLPREAIVLDPMNGSGTSTVVAQALGYCAIGFDLNPAMAWIAGAKDASAAHWVDLDALLNDYVRDAPATGSLPSVANTWMSGEAYSRLAALVSAASVPVGELDWADPLLALVAEVDLTSGRRSFLPACALLSVRALAPPTRRSNPTWLGPPVRRKRRLVAIDTVLKRRAYTMKCDLESAFLPADKRRLLVGLADARRLPLPDDCVDAVISSPPYVTRLDYAASTAPELALLGVDGQSRLEPLRRKLIGSPITCGFEAANEVVDCRGVLKLLNAIRCHDSKASDGYYSRFFVHYFRDAQRLLREIGRVLKPSGAAMLVVQDSWYKDIHVPLGELFLELAESIGLSGRIAQSELVRYTLTTINPRAKAYNKGSVHEHVLLLRSSS